VADLKELRFDRASVFLELRLAERTFQDQRLGGSILAPVTLPSMSLEAGKTARLELTLPALKAGELGVTAVYMGGAARVASKPLALKIEPKDGSKVARVRLVTNRGVVTLKLFPDDALATCNHFARHIAQSFYNGGTFHRVIPNFMVQGGCPKGDGTGGPGYTIPFEKNSLKHRRGRLAMAKMAHPDSGGSQFYICVGQPSHLDGKHVVFGEVVKGYELVELHAKASTVGSDRPVEEQRIRHMSLVP
jgi:peptidyl-prolyl cis-trans isomerase B (cyclophilin B)